MTASPPWELVCLSDEQSEQQNCQHHLEPFSILRSEEAYALAAPEALACYP